MSSYHSLLREVGNRACIIAVSKGRSIDEMRILYDEGCRDFGESRVNELLQKIDLMPSDVRWHFIGTLQSNKVGKIVGLTHLIHSVDTPELARKIAAASKGSETAILLQVNTSGEITKHGLSVEAWLPHLEALSRLPSLQIKGLMTMAPKTKEEDRIRSCFQALAKAKESFERVLGPLQHLSMGMSSDWRIALEEKATLLRIGTRLFEIT